MTYCLVNKLDRCYLADEWLTVIVTNIFNCLLNIGFVAILMLLLQLRGVLGTVSCAKQRILSVNL